MSTRSSYAEGTPSWVDLQTPDQPGAKEFYTALFGWSYDDRPTPEGSIYSIATLRDERVAAIAPQDAPPGTPPVWNTFLAVDDADATAAKVAPAGGRIILPTFDVGDAGRMVFVADPAGAAVGLWQAGRHIGATLVNEPGALIWNELVTDRPAEALPFYESVVGMTSTVMPMEGGDYTVLQIGSDGVGGCMPPPQPDMPSYWHVYFCTDDADATAAKAAAEGGALMAEPFDLKTVGRMAVLSDPQGAVFSVMQPEPAE